jgi:hypothetical protein
MTRRDPTNDMLWFGLGLAPVLALIVPGVAGEHATLCR